MKGEVLLLNQNWTPLNILKMNKAIGKWMKGKVDVIETKDNYFMYEGKKQFFPVVMVMNYFVDGVTKKRNLRDFYTKINVWKRDKGICQYCGKKVSAKDFTVDHVIPKKAGGLGEWTNVVTSCFKCNNLKDSRNLKADGTLTIKTKDGKTYHLKLLNQPKIPDLPETIEKTILHRFRNLKRIHNEAWKKYIK